MFFVHLGLVTSLQGLNIANNPLEFPPESIIEGGIKSILAFFRDLLRAKSEAGSGLCLASITDLFHFSVVTTVKRIVP